MDNFIVSARKYRPATFMSVVGQQHITDTLRNAIGRSQLAHAYLFCGPRGVGKTTCARIFAKAINCSNPHQSEACGECESCRNFAEGRSFNIHELDAASNNSVDDIRALTEQVRIPPQVGRYSVYIIDEVHMLSASAFNAFLKTLEEPPAHAIFILATTEKHKILPTILSRCQIYDFNRIRVEDSVGYLKQIAASEGVSFDDESLNLIAQKADGGMRDALSMFDKAVAFCGNDLNFRQVARTLNVLDYDTYFTILDTVASGDYKSVLRQFDEVLKAGFSGQTFVAGLNAHMRDLLLGKDPATQPLLDVAGTLLERYREQSERFDPGFLFDAIALMSQIDSSFRTVTNQRLHVELGLMKLCGMGQKKNSLESSAVSLPKLREPASSVPEKERGNVGRVSGHTPTAKETAGAGEVDAKTDRPRQETTVCSGENEPGSREAGLPGKQEPREVCEPGKEVVADSASIGATLQSGVVETETLPENSAGDERGFTADTVNEIESGQTSDGEAAPSQTRGAPGRQGVSGVSINNILRRNGMKSPAEEGGEKKPASREEPDPGFSVKLETSRADFLEALERWRPRFATALHGMEVSENIIRAKVSNELLREDMVQNQKEIIDILRRHSGITGPVILQVDISEEKMVVRPIKPEDKLNHLREKNPLVDDLRRELGLEIE